MCNMHGPLQMSVTSTLHALCSLGEGRQIYRAHRRSLRFLRCLAAPLEAHDALPGAAARDCGHLGAPTLQGPDAFPRPAAALPDVRPRPSRLSGLALHTCHLNTHREAKCFANASAASRCVYSCMEAAGEAREPICILHTTYISKLPERDVVFATNACLAGQPSGTPAPTKAALRACALSEIASAAKSVYMLA